MILLHKPAFQRKLLQEVDKLKQNIDAAKDGIFIPGFNLLTNSAIQSILCDKQKDKVSKNIIRPILFEACIRSEMLAAGGGSLCLNYIVDILPDILKSFNSCHFDVGKELDATFESIALEIKHVGKRPCKKSVKKHINDFDIDENFKVIVSKALELSLIHI